MYSLTFAAEDAVGLVLLVAISLVTPAIGPKGVFFGVTVTPSFGESEAGRAVLRGYRRRVLAWALLGALMIVVGVARQAPALSMLALLPALLGLFHGYFAGRRQALPHAVSGDGARSIAIIQRMTLAQHAAWQVPGWATLAASASYIARFRDTLPEQVAVHFNRAGGADRFIPRTSPALFFPIGTAAVLLLGMLALGWIIESRSRLGTQRNVSASRTALIGGANVAAITCSAAALGPFLGTTFVLVLSGISLTALSIAIGIAAMRTGTVNIGDGSPDSCWKWGLFYVNRDDPALLVPKRFGIGYTLNFGHKGAWAILAATLAPFVVIAIAASAH